MAWSSEAITYHDGLVFHAALTPTSPNIEDIDFASRRGLDRRNTLQLAQGAWLKAHENFIITGLTGTGKTWLACAFGRQAARLDHSVLYLRMPRLFEDLAMARLDGRFPRLIDKLARVQFLTGRRDDHRGGEDQGDPRQDQRVQGGRGTARWLAYGTYKLKE